MVPSTLLKLGKVDGPKCPLAGCHRFLTLCSISLGTSRQFNLATSNEAIERINGALFGLDAW